MKKNHRILFFLALLVIFSSCLKNEICSPVDIELQAGIYSINETNGIYDTVALKIDVDTLYSIGIEEGHNLLLNASQIVEISFPLDNTSTETSFVLNREGIKDTIHFFYQKHLLFNSVKCGVAYTYTITDFKISKHLLKNIILTNPEIDVLSAENILLVY